MRRSFLRFHVPDVGEAEVAAVTKTLRSGWLTTGPKVRQFEERFARFVGARHAVAVNSGTAALHLALAAVDIQEGDEVIVPTMTFAATAEVVLYFKAKPVLVDCRPDTLNLDPDRMEQAITHRTRAIIPVHFGGHPCDMGRILKVARRHRLRVIEDAAHALPAACGGRRVGTLGDFTCFSFYATKTITTGEGGMVTTQNPAWADRIRILSLHGISREARNRYLPGGSWSYEILCPGYKYNMTDVAAAMGIPQLRKCLRGRRIRERYARMYTEGLREVAEIQTPQALPGVQHAWHLYVIQVKPDRLRITRDDLIERLREEGIGTSVHFIPLHRHPYYRNTFGCRPGDFPTASALSERILSLPLYSRMSEADVERVIGTLKRIVRRHAR